MPTLCSLDLSNNGIVGEIPIDLVMRFTKLTSLDLSAMGLQGELPLEIIRRKQGGSCAVRLVGNEPGFTLPSNLRELGESVTRLDLSECSLRGPPLEDMMQLLEPFALTLESLSLSRNPAFRGCKIPIELPAKFTKLTHLDLAETGLEGMQALYPTQLAHLTFVDRSRRRAAARPHPH